MSTEPAGVRTFRSISPGFPTAVAGHYRDFFRRPLDVPVTVGVNAGLMCAGWFLLPTWVQAWLFSLHGPLAFPVVLASWMVADTPATNVLAYERAGSAVLEGPVGCRRWLASRSVALGLLVAVPCLVLAVVVGAVQRQWPLTVVMCLAILVAPLGTLPLSACLGLLLPYRPQPLGRRWEQRAAWRTQLRWAALVVAPYVLVPAIGVALVVPAIAVELAVRGRSRDLHPRDVLLVAVTIVLTVVVAGGAGLAAAARITKRRAVPLAAFLTDRPAG